ncbi:MAG: 50S ribosomal protein L31e [Candidatus Bathyarchaeota archaeon]|nr:50S ribosomal protein L31e [Candidatus Bathyarchaeota archaeon]MDH5786919.1 50S ribosomal protein L31e [Candidatus Bathyarchaeota archaeon]
MGEKSEKEEQKTEEESEESEETVEEAEIQETAEGVLEEKEEEEEELEEEAVVSETEAVEAEEAPTPVEEAKPPSREEKTEEEIVEERIYTIPLGKVWIRPPNKRAPRAMRMIKSFITKHMKLEVRREREEEEMEEPKRLIISNEVNMRVWSRGIEKPPRKIRVRAAKDKEGNVTVYLAEGD